MANTLYVVVYSSALGAPSAAQIKAGQNVNGTAATYTNAPTGVAWSAPGQQVTASGLTSGTSYKASAVVSDGVTDSNVVTSSAFITPVTYTLSPGGTLTFSGTAQSTKDDVFDAGGTIVFSGSVEQIKEKVYAPEGTLTFSGTAGITLTKGSTEWTITPSGGITFSGAPLQIHENIFEPSGSITFSGTNSLIKENIYEPSGSIVFSGTAPLTLVPAGSVLISTYRPLTGVGH